MTISLYRRYRPRTFDEVAGQDMAVDVLKRRSETAGGSCVPLLRAQGMRKNIPGQAPHMSTQLYGPEGRIRTVRRMRGAPPSLQGKASVVVEIDGTSTTGSKRSGN